MAPINTKLHGGLDYTISILLMFSPWLFNYSRTYKDVLIPVICGAISILYTLFTDCEFGIVKKIRLSNHFLLDLVMGSFLVAAPKIFNYDGYVFILPYLWIGLIKIFISLSAGNVLHSKHVKETTSNGISTSFHTFFHWLQHHLYSLYKQLISKEKKTIVEQ